MQTEEIKIDPFEQNLKLFKDVEEEIQLEDLANPTAIKLLLHERSINLVNLRENQEKINILTNEIKILRQSENSLKIKLVKSSVLSKTTWIEIPISILSGYSINLLTSDLNNSLAWVILVLCISILLLVRINFFEKMDGEK